MDITSQRVLTKHERCAMSSVLEMSFSSDGSRKQDCERREISAFLSLCGIGEMIFSVVPLFFRIVAVKRRNLLRVIKKTRIRVTGYYYILFIRLILRNGSRMVV